MELHESDSHAHVMQKRVGNAGGHGQPENHVSHSQRKDIPIAPEHFAKEESSQRASNRQNRIGYMCGSEQNCGSQHRAPGCPAAISSAPVKAANDQSVAAKINPAPTIQMVALPVGNVTPISRAE